MSAMSEPPPSTDVIQGTLDMLILKALSLEPMHGFVDEGYIIGALRESRLEEGVSAGLWVHGLHEEGSGRLPVELDELIDALRQVRDTGLDPALAFHIAAEEDPIDR